MKRQFSKILAVICLILTASSFAQLNTGDQSPNPVLPIIDRNSDKYIDTRLYDYKQDAVLLVAFVPSMTDATNYSNVLIGSFDTYFGQGLAFPQAGPWANGMREDLRVLIVTQDNRAAVNTVNSSNYYYFDVICDGGIDVIDYFGVKKTDNKNSAATVYVIDKNNKVVYADNNYKGEGEKLKTVQSQLFKEFNIAQNFSEDNPLPLMAGDKARDFDFEYVDVTGMHLPIQNARLSDYKGKNVLIAFYPAAYSYGCAMEVKTFDRQLVNDIMMNKIQKGELENVNDLEILMVSMSEINILSKWKDDLNLKNVKLVNDRDGSISSKYNSLNSFYNKRTLFLINKEGNVSYIDWDYRVDDTDFSLLKDQIRSIN